MNSLPNEILVEIFCVLSYECYHNVATVCRQFANILMAPKIWEKVCKDNQVVKTSDSHYQGAKAELYPYFQWEHCYESNNNTKLKIGNMERIFMTTRPLTRKHNRFSVRVTKVISIDQITVGFGTRYNFVASYQHSRNFSNETYITYHGHKYPVMTMTIFNGDVITFVLDFEMNTAKIYNDETLVHTIERKNPWAIYYPTVYISEYTTAELVQYNKIIS